MAKAGSTWLIAAVIVGVLLVGDRARADGDAGELFEELYAARVERELASGDPDRIVALARELLEGDGESDLAVAVWRRQLDAAYELAAPLDAGREVAIEAARTLADHFPDEREAAYERVLAVLQQHYTRSNGGAKARAAAELAAELRALADRRLVIDDDAAGAEALLRRAEAVARSQSLAETASLAERRRAVAARRRAQERADRLSVRRQAEPQAAELARDLVMAYIIELDSPADAAKYVASLRDERLGRRVNLAAQPVTGLRPADAYELGRWYRELAGEVGDRSGKAMLLDRARLYYRYYLDIDDSADPNRRDRARLLLDDLTAQAAELGAAGVLPARHVRAKWTVVFESDNPLEWDPGGVPQDMLYVRLRRMDTGDYVIISVGREQLRERAEGERFIWNGTSGTSRGVHYLGIANKSWRNPYRQGGHIVQVTGHRDGYGGWGFGRKSLINSDQIQMWADEIIETEDMVVMQIAVTPGPLNSSDQRRLLE